MFPALSVNMVSRNVILQALTSICTIVSNTTLL